MPNVCVFELRVRGSKENCKEFYKVMTDYNMPRHFWRVFEADIIDECGTEDSYYMNIKGSCAWSIYSCMTSGGYAKDHTDSGTGLQEESGRLELDIEIWSEEKFGCFEEHYYYSKGKTICDKCYDNVEWLYWDKDYYTFEEFCEGSELEGFTEEDVNDEGYIVINYVDWNFSIDASGNREDKELEMLTKIAKENFVYLESREDLEAHNNDDEDFFEVAIWELKQALIQSCELGKKLQEKYAK